MKPAKIEDKYGIKIGVSSAASWAWGTSLVLGMEIAQQRGNLTFLIWAGANTFTLILFGILMYKGVIKPAVFDNVIVKSIALVIQMFCLIIQLNIINQTLRNFIDNGMVTYAIASAIGIIFTVAMFKHGLPSSVKADLVKWGIALVSVFAISAIGFMSGAEPFEFNVASETDIQWGIWSACILLCGLIGDVQHWQRAISDETKKGYYWGALFFGIYMVGIYLMAHFHFTSVMNVVLLIACLAVTISTINSIAVAMHELGNKNIGTVITIAICLLWGLGIGIGVMDLWSNFGIVRVCFAIIVVISSLVVAEMIKGTEYAKKKTGDNE